MLVGRSVMAGYPLTPHRLIHSGLNTFCLHSIYLNHYSKHPFLWIIPKLSNQSSSLLESTRA